MDLKEKNALITGAAQGIGKAIALTFAKAGANVIISDINLELATQTAEEAAKLGVKAKAIKQNVADLTEVEATVKEVHAEFGKIDILINNAGITKDNLLLRMKKEDWDAVININLSSVFNLCKVIAPIMMKQRSGKIINIASIVGEMGNAGQINYSASKAGVIGVTKSLAKELASRNITVNAIAPGFIQTAMTDRIPEDIKKKMLEQIPLGKLGQPEDIASACLFLASDAGSYITGQVIRVNGGMYM
ncbi:beta-ketoacyl-ACP reductase [Candidatus Saganbacteria bacterium CG08_land_8_20_14_0_20_45_16]|uniref:3-oxoacyl-[acyl-carrier-protein] reductase n=1 Tax=Candidatus Saganbacteria bacterium CG08_land_8_20_14_0_20_45_16 TaxID=2014293 RepID=A0A2H0Y0E6_UNCSA|nr:MAG: beta-ketoacyl-ACP reductase [Candidatus Saganbacteria bacterium CG08_land_8_20_14_0_20_45_16]